MSNVKESKEMLVGALALGLFLYSKFKDGVQGSDFVAIIQKFEQDPEFKAKIEAAYTDADNINVELKGIDLAGYLELGSALIKELPSVLAALPAPAAVVADAAPAFADEVKA